MNNSVTLIGRITKELEIKEIGETKILNFSVAVDRNYKTKDGENLTDFIPCVAFNGISELMNKYCKKGDKICVSGRLQSSKYEKDGENRYSYDVIVYDITFLEPKKDEENEK